MRRLLRGLCNPTLQTFLDTSVNFDEARYVLCGAPVDLTASHRSGSRFAPAAIRQASLYMETHSLRWGMDLDDVAVSDMGDIRAIEDIEGALGNVEKVVELIRGANKTPILIGGEHTVTLGALRALKPDLVVCFDAHLDLRDQLLGLRMSHATFMRRALEELGPRAIIVGGRAISKEESEFVDSNPDKLTVVSALDLLGKDNKRYCDYIRDEVAGAPSAYISIDMDVLDPSYAPAVGNPSPEGISVNALMNLIEAATGKNVLGFDLTEVAPHYDSGTTATTAAHILLETIYGLEAHRGPKA